MTDQENENTMLARATADSMMFQEKANALEKERNALQLKVITGNQLVQAQALRADGKTKADIANLVGVEHQALADLLGGVDTIVAKATAGTYTESQYKALADSHAALTQQLDILKQSHDDVVRSLQEKTDALYNLQRQLGQEPPEAVITP